MKFTQLKTKGKKDWVKFTPKEGDPYRTKSVGRDFWKGITSINESNSRPSTIDQGPTLIKIVDGKLCLVKEINDNRIKITH